MTTLRKEMSTVEYLEARLWDSIREIDSNRDEYSDQELRRAFTQMQALSEHIKLKIVNNKGK